MRFTVTESIQRHMPMPRFEIRPRRFLSESAEIRLCCGTFAISRSGTPFLKLIRRQFFLNQFDHFLHVLRTHRIPITQRRILQLAMIMIVRYV